MADAMTARFDEQMRAMKDEIVNRALGMISRGEMTPELSRDLWSEIAAVERFRKNVLTRGVIATMLAMEKQKDLTSPPANDNGD